MGLMKEAMFNSLISESLEAWQRLQQMLFINKGMRKGRQGWLIGRGMEIDEETALLSLKLHLLDLAPDRGS
ncbi:hypothetical protein SRHO_G00055640 [Serrasalmus rhombeus]